jgi:hypothetical protein
MRGDGQGLIAGDADEKVNHPGHAGRGREAAGSQVEGLVLKPVGRRGRVAAVLFGRPPFVWFPAEHDEGDRLAQRPRAEQREHAAGLGRERSARDQQGQQVRRYGPVPALRVRFLPDDVPVSLPADRQGLGRRVPPVIAPQRLEMPIVRGLGRQDAARSEPVPRGRHQRPALHDAPMQPQVQ